MTCDEEERAWQVAFARQAASDLDVYELLCDQVALPSCHRLHYLQMALEKMAKAYSWDPDREVELLAPAVDDSGRRPDNCEYPWAEVDGDGETVRLRVPVEQRFDAEDMLRRREARQMLKFVRGWLDGHG